MRGTFVKEIINDDEMFKGNDEREVWGGTPMEFLIILVIMLYIVYRDNHDSTSKK